MGGEGRFCAGREDLDSGGRDAIDASPKFRDQKLYGGPLVLLAPESTLAAGVRAQEVTASGSKVDELGYSICNQWLKPFFCRNSERGALGMCRIDALQ